MIKHKLLQIKNPGLKRGFTIVELLVVVTVIGILVTVGVFAYINVKKQSYDATVISKVEWLERQLEKYRSDHGEYPLMATLNTGTSSTNTTMTDFTAAATVLGVKTEFLNDPSGIKFHTICATGCGTGVPQKNQYLYIGLNAAGNVTNGTYVWSTATIGCTVTVQYNNPSYVFVYFNSFKNLWIFNKSPQGTATIANFGGGPTAPQTCTFT